MKIDWKAAFKIAAVYVGTVVGAGFATGREIVEFFSRYGFLGIFGILLAGYMFTFLGAKLMRLAASIRAESYDQFNLYLFGRFFGRFINVLMGLMLLGVCAVMLSGAGAVFEEHLGMDKNTGILLTIALSIVVMMLGVQGLFAVNSFVVPLMVIFNLILVMKASQMPGFIESVLEVPGEGAGWKWTVSPFIYIAFNLSLAQAVLVPIAREVKDDQTVKWGGIIGGSILTLILLAEHLTLVLLPNLESYEIPMAVLMKNLAPGLYTVFLMIIFGEIFTSVIGNVFGLEKQLAQHHRLPGIAVVSMLFLFCYLIGQVGYSKLLSYLYPLFGYISLVFIILLWMKPYKKRV